MTEKNNGGTLFNYIEKMNLNLVNHVSMNYIEFVYDVVIQLCNGVIAAHRNGLVHGQLDLSKVVLHFSGK